MKIVVTGVAGFIGSYVASRLLAKGCHVIGIDNLNSYYDVRIKQARLALLQETRQFRFICMNIVDHQALLGAVDSDTDLIVHMAAQAGVRYSLENPQSYVDANMAGQVNIFETAGRLPKCPAVIYASSSSVYGLNKKIPFCEEDMTESPASLYGASKKAGELIAHSYGHIYGIRHIGLRFFTVYGPHGRPDMAPWLFTQAILRKEPIKLFNNGVMQRDFTYIDDIIDGIMAVVERLQTPINKLKPIYNLGNNKPVALMDFVAAIEKATGEQAIKEFHPLQAGDVEVTYANIDAAHQDLQFEPKIAIEQGMAKFVNWFRREGLT